MSQLQDRGVECGRLEFSCVLYLGLPVFLSTWPDFFMLPLLIYKMNKMALLPGIL